MRNRVLASQGSTTPLIPHIHRKRGILSHCTYFTESYSFLSLCPGNPRAAARLATFLTYCLPVTQTELHYYEGLRRQVRGLLADLGFPDIPAQLHVTRRCSELFCCTRHTKRLLTSYLWSQSSEYRCSRQSPGSCLARSSSLRILPVPNLFFQFRYLLEEVPRTGATLT